MLPECGSDEAVVALERLRKTLECHPVTTESGDVPVTVSIGIASFTDAMETPGNILARADKALYEAKESGRNRLVLNPLSATL